MSDQKQARLDTALATMGPEESKVLLGELIPELNRRAELKLRTLVFGLAARSGHPTPAPSQDQIKAGVKGIKTLDLDTDEAAEAVLEALELGLVALLGGEPARASTIYGAMLQRLDEDGRRWWFDSHLDDARVRYLQAKIKAARSPEEAARELAGALLSSKVGRKIRCPLRALERTGLALSLDVCAAWREHVRAGLTSAKPAKAKGSKAKGSITKATGASKGKGSKAEEAILKTWLREVTLHLDGADGLAALARASRDPADFRAWLDRMESEGEQSELPKACAEAAERVKDTTAAAEFYGRAASLAGDAESVAEYLEKAWRLRPELFRLRQLLGQQPPGDVLRRFAATLRGHGDPQQNAALAILAGELDDALTLPAEGDWTEAGHPGEVLAPMIARLLDLRTADEAEEAEEAEEARRDEPPTLEELVDRAELTPLAPDTRQRLIQWLKDTADDHLACALDAKRGYPATAFHAVLAARADGREEAFEALERQRTKLKRFKALNREIGDELRRDHPDDRLELETDGVHRILDMEKTRRVFAEVPAESFEQETITSAFDLLSCEVHRSLAEPAPTDLVPVDVFVWGKGPAANRRMTRLGGCPWLPKSRPWPSDPDGVPAAFLAQVCFADSRELLDPAVKLPGDILLIFANRVSEAEDDEALCCQGDWFHFEWAKLDDEAIEAFPPGARAVTVTEFYGVRHRTLEVKETEQLEDPEELHEYGNWIRPLSATKIGISPFAIQDEHVSEGRFLCQLGPLQPASQTFPWTNRRERPPEGFGPHSIYEDDNSFMIGDMGALYLDLTDGGEVEWSIQSY